MEWVVQVLRNNVPRNPGLKLAKTRGVGKGGPSGLVKFFFL